MITRSPVAANNKFNHYYLIYYYLNNAHYTFPSTVRILEMSLRKYFTPVPRIGGEDEPPAKRSCIGSPEEADLQEEAYALPYGSFHMKSTKSKKNSRGIFSELVHTHPTSSYV